MEFKNVVEILEVIVVFLMRAVPEFLEIIVWCFVAVFLVYMFIYAARSVL